MSRVEPKKRRKSIPGRDQLTSVMVRKREKALFEEPKEALYGEGK